MVSSLWSGNATMKDDASRIPPAKFQLLHKAALDACDASDGVKDEIITNPPPAHFDPGVLQCKGGDSADCLTAPQVAAVRAVYAGPKNPRTNQPITRVCRRQRTADAGLDDRRRAVSVATTFFRGDRVQGSVVGFPHFDYDHGRGARHDVRSRCARCSGERAAALFRGEAQVTADATAGQTG
jgi:hypothetical protein